MNLTAELLRQLLHYDPETGIFTRIKIVAPQSRIRIGDIAGCDDGQGYIRIKLGGRSGRSYGAHRLAWLYMTGQWPDSEVDHKDRNPSNNRWTNLRLADRTTNIANTKRRSDNLSGFKGVCWNEDSRKFRSEISVRGKRVFLGYFETAEEAHAAYGDAARKHFGEFARTA